MLKLKKCISASKLNGPEIFLGLLSMSRWSLIQALDRGAKLSNAYVP